MNVVNVVNVIMLEIIHKITATSEEGRKTLAEKVGSPRYIQSHPLLSQDQVSSSDDGPAFVPLVD